MCSPASRHIAQPNQSTTRGPHQRCQHAYAQQRAGKYSGSTSTCHQRGPINGPASTGWSGAGGVPRFWLWMAMSSAGQLLLHMRPTARGLVLQVVIVRPYRTTWGRVQIAAQVRKSQTLQASLLLSTVCNSIPMLAGLQRVHGLQFHPNACRRQAQLTRQHNTVLVVLAVLVVLWAHRPRAPLVAFLVGLLVGLLAPCWLCWLCFGRIGLGRLSC